jgi:hypothetical protein
MVNKIENIYLGPKALVFLLGHGRASKTHSYYEKHINDSHIPSGGLFIAIEHKKSFFAT